MTGDAVVGKTLTATPSVANAAGTYQWLRCENATDESGTNIGENQNTYQLVAADAGKYIRVKFTATGSYSGAPISAATAKIAAGASVELAKITNDVVKTVPFGTENTKAGVETAMLVLANAAVDSVNYTVNIAEGSTYEGNAWTGKFVVTNKTVATDTKTDEAERSITVEIAAFVPVTDITDVPTTATAGTEVDLTVAKVVPDTATNKTIVWSIKNAGDTGVSDVAEGKFTAANAGTLELTATIANGTAVGTEFTKDFTITVAAAPTPAPELTGFTWAAGTAKGTQATVVPEGTLKYVVGAEGAQTKPNVGDEATAYTAQLTANTDIEVTAGQHIFIVKLDAGNKVIQWVDVTVEEANVYQ